MKNIKFHSRDGVYYVEKLIDGDYHGTILEIDIEQDLVYTTSQDISLRELIKIADHIKSLQLK